MKSDGIDTRTWVSLARVDDDPDAVRYDTEFGWLVDVTFVGGPLDGEGPLVCRLGSMGARRGVTSQQPVGLGCLVLVLVPAGDINVEPTIISMLHDINCVAPTTVNGTEITEEFAAETHVQAFPGEDLDAEYRAVRVTGDSVVLGAAEADQPFARGNDLADALDNLAGALDTFAVALGSGTLIGMAPVVYVGGSANPALVALRSAITQFEGARNAYLSTRINGD